MTENRLKLAVKVCSSFRNIVLFDPSAHTLYGNICHMRVQK